MPRLSLPLAAAGLLWCLSAAAAAEHRVEKLAEAPPAEELAPEIAATLRGEGFRVLRGESTILCDVWFCQEWPGEGATSAEVLYPFTPGQLLGVVRFARKSADFRDQDLAKGVYTLRYAHQPVDGAHVGTSPTRDFLLLAPAAKDTSPAPLEYKPLVALSKEVAESNHPAMLSLQRPADPAAAAPSIRFDETHEWWIVRLEGPAVLEFVIVGVAAE